MTPLKTARVDIDIFGDVTVHDVKKTVESFFDMAEIEVQLKEHGGKNMSEVTLQNLTESINTLAESLTNFTNTMNNFSKNILLDSIFWDGTEEDSKRVVEWFDKYNERAIRFWDSEEDEYTILIEDYFLYVRGSGYFLHDNKSFTFVPEEDFR